MIQEVTFPDIAGQLLAGSAQLCRKFLALIPSLRYRKMGPSEDPMAVVDAMGRCHGVEQLVVADASIMPLCRGPIRI